MHPETPREAQPVPAKADGWKPAKELKLRRRDTPEATATYAASVLAGPELAASRVIMAAEGNSPYAESMLDGTGMLDHLAEQARAVSAGDMTQAEAMLHTQAVGLQSLFVRLVERAMRSEYTASFDVNMRHALAAQRQSARALETLAMLRQGPTVFARQANVVNGPQQVNIAAEKRGPADAVPCGR